MLRKFLVMLCLTALFFSIGASAQTQQCDNQAVPAGQVIIKRFQSSGCFGSPTGGPLSSLHTLLVQAPTDPIDVCTESPRPSGWVVTKVFTTTNCWSTLTWSQTNATFTIRQPVSPMVVCSQSPVPQGYVITKVRNSNECWGLNNSNAYSSFHIKIPTATQENICANSPIPSTYTRGGSFYTGDCTYSGSSQTANAYTINKK